MPRPERQALALSQGALLRSPIIRVEAVAQDGRRSNALQVKLEELALLMAGRIDLKDWTLAQRVTPVLYSAWKWLGMHFVAEWAVAGPEEALAMQAGAREGGEMAALTGQQFQVLKLSLRHVVGLGVMSCPGKPEVHVHAQQIEDHIAFYGEQSLTLALDDGSVETLAPAKIRAAKLDHISFWRLAACSSVNEVEEAVKRLELLKAEVAILRKRTEADVLAAAAKEEGIEVPGDQDEPTAPDASAEGEQAHVVTDDMAAAIAEAARDDTAALEAAESRLEALHKQAAAAAAVAAAKAYAEAAALETEKQVLDETAAQEALDIWSFEPYNRARREDADTIHGQQLYNSLPDSALTRVCRRLSIKKSRKGTPALAFNKLLFSERSVSFAGNVAVCCRPTHTTSTMSTDVGWRCCVHGSTSPPRRHVVHREARPAQN